MIKGLISAVGSIFTAFSPLGPFGIPLAIASIATIYALVGKAKSQKVDDVGYGNNTLVTKNKGAIMLNNNDSIVAGTNLLGGGGGEKIDYDKMALAMSKAQVNVSTQYDSFSANSTTAHGGNYQSTARNESKFV